MSPAWLFRLFLLSPIAFFTACEPIISNPTEDPPERTTRVEEGYKKPEFRLLGTDSAAISRSNEDDQMAIEVEISKERNLRLDDPKMVVATDGTVVLLTRDARVLFFDTNGELKQILEIQGGFTTPTLFPLHDASVAIALDDHLYFFDTRGKLLRQTAQAICKGLEETPFQLKDGTIVLSCANRFQLLRKNGEFQTEIAHPDKSTFFERAKPVGDDSWLAESHAESKEGTQISLFVLRTDGTYKRSEVFRTLWQSRLASGIVFEGDGYWGETRVMNGNILYEMVPQLSIEGTRESPQETFVFDGDADIIGRWATEAVLSEPMWQSLHTQTLSNQSQWMALPFRGPADQVFAGERGLHFRKSEALPWTKVHDLGPASYVGEQMTPLGITGDGFAVFLYDMLGRGTLYYCGPDGKTVAEFAARFTGRAIGQNLDDARLLADGRVVLSGKDYDAPKDVLLFFGPKR
jgi:hypothetical protein